MGTPRKSVRKTEFGDFQTPLPLARQVCARLAARGFRPASILEPTCGLGSLILAAAEGFPEAAPAVGVEINAKHIQAARAAVARLNAGDRIALIEGDFYAFDWPALLARLPDPLLVIGNPPWVTNSQLGALGSVNLPEKTNFQKHRGLDALTGKSNFDISLWMLIQMLHWVENRNAMLAMLCKTSVARKLLSYAWQNALPLTAAEIHTIDAEAAFGASVEACLLCCVFGGEASVHEALVFPALSCAEPRQRLGFRSGDIVANIEAYQRWRHLQGTAEYRWRSGVKHDCSKICELRREGQRYRNGLGELVELEDDYLYPLLKGTDVARSRAEPHGKWMLVTQRQIGEDTAAIRHHAPQTWQYLCAHTELLDRRGSSIYRNRPPFSMFGIGDYTFAPHKVAISGLHKQVQFLPVGNCCGKPIVLDDTCYFLPCDSAEEAQYLAELLNSPVAQAFFSAFLFWDMKRPITVDLLRRLSLRALARELGSAPILAGFLADKTAGLSISDESPATQLTLFERA